MADENSPQESHLTDQAASPEARVGFHRQKCLPAGQEGYFENLWPKAGRRLPKSHGKSPGGQTFGPGQGDLERHVPPRNDRLLL